MNEGVKILVERIETHPEEFDGLALSMDSGIGERLYTSKWGGVFARYWMVLTKEEQELIKAKMTEANRHNFTTAVIQTIMVKDKLVDAPTAVEGSILKTVGYPTPISAVNPINLTTQGRSITNTSAVWEKP